MGRLPSGVESIEQAYSRMISQTSRFDPYHRPVGHTFISIISNIHRNFVSYLISYRTGIYPKLLTAYCNSAIT